MSQFKMHACVLNIPAHLNKPQESFQRKLLFHSIRCVHLKNALFHAEKLNSAVESISLQIVCEECLATQKIS